MIWRQLFALIALRIKLTNNQQLKVGKWNLYLSRILFVLLWITSISSFFIMAIGGAFLFRQFPVESCYSIWAWALLALLFYWFIMVLGQLQQTETIAFEKLLHMPVSLKGAFFLNYSSSYANSAVWLGGPILFGMSIGMIFAQGAPMWKLLPATFAVFLKLATLTYLLRGWFARLTANKRIKPFVMIAFPSAMIVVFMLLVGKAEEESWRGNITAAIRQSFTTGPSAFAIVAMFAISAASLYLSYRSLVRAYVGTQSNRKIKARTTSTPPRTSNFLYRKLPGISPQASAVATATIRTLARSPELFAALLPIAVLLFFGSPYLLKMNDYTIPLMVRPWIPQVVLVVIMLSFPAFLFSVFSYDRDGFRALVLSPVRRKDILIGKNAAIGILTFVSGVLVFVLLQIFLPYSIPTFLASIVQVLACFLLMAIIGNFLSVYCPVGLKRGTMQPTNAPVLSTVLLYVGVICSPMFVVQPASVACTIAILSTGTLVEINGWIYLWLSVLQLILVVAAYWWTLGLFDEIFWKRESTIVNIVANIPE